MRAILQSWGRIHRTECEVVDITNRFSKLPGISATALPFGNGRSYGDSCINSDMALRTKNLNNFVSFDREAGILICEAGLLLSEILKVIVPQGWFLPVTPGTRYITVGGAIANDIHGKNHHRAGTFGCHVLRFEILRSDGTRMICSRDENSDWFAATIGGLGLTGLIVWAEIRLKRIPGPWMEVETRHFSNLDEFQALSVASDESHEYTVSWIDGARNDGSGILMRGHHADPQNAAYKTRHISLPFTPPVSLVNRLTVKMFNKLYRAKPDGAQVQHYEKFFYPLDSLQSWNRIYGPSGFYQYQCVIPQSCGIAPIREILDEAARSGMHSFLTVLKSFGDISSPGLLSFPCRGYTLAIDFPNRGEQTLQFLERLDATVKSAGGRLYPAKDGRMPGSFFRESYPQWEKFSSFIDPKFSSVFWQRVMEGA